MKRFLVTLGFLTLVGWAGFSWAMSRPIETPPGVLASADPVQDVSKPVTLPEIKGYTLKAAATYSLRARVLHTKRYWADGGDLVPYDVALGWGPMSDKKVLDRLTISQGNRFFFYEFFGAPPIPAEQIACHASNNHVIAANSTVASGVSSLRAGQIVDMSGYLVNVTKGDFRWDTSMRRDDTGKGACEIFYVEDLQVEN